MPTNSLLPEIAQYTEEFFHSNNKPYLFYHNIDHTRRVVQYAKEISIYYKLDENTIFTILAAAWFHDTGYLLGDPVGHEERGVQLMKEFLTGKDVDEKVINDISLCIMATKLPPAPSSLLQEIICDADTYHLGTRDFLHLDKLLWQEVEHRFNKPVDNKVIKSLHFLEKHQFFTSYCQQLLAAGKDRNISQLEMLL